MNEYFQKRLNWSLSTLLWLMLALGTSSAYAQDDALLPPEEAYAFEAVTTNQGIDANWTIAEGYYMYRDKLSFSLQDADGNDIPLEYDFPKSKRKKDSFFGDVEVYYKQANFQIPLTGRTASQDVVLTVKGQGCNDPVGVCYPPMTRSFPLTLVSSASAQISSPLQQADPAQTQPEALSSIDDLRSLLGADMADDALLPPDQAFNVTASTDQGSLVVQFKVADGYYLYKDKLKFSSDTHPLSKPFLPEGKLKEDAYFGASIVYRNGFEALLQASTAKDGDTLTLQAEYQGCADAGVCYPPQLKKFELPLTGLLSSANAQTAAAGQSSLVAAGDAQPDSAQQVEMPAVTTANPATAPVTTQALASGDGPGVNDALWWVLGMAFLAGIGLTFTPCVLPLVPILSSVIGGQGPGITKKKAAALAAIYVLGTAVTYAAIGAVAGATGDQLQSYFQNVWAIGIMAAIFVLMALSMFGLFEIQLPSSIQSRLASTSQGIKGGSVLWVFVLGLISALIVGACVSPVLISFLGLAIAKGSPVLGAMTMFSMAMGMGIPLILIGMGAGHLIPKAGAWMDTVKYVFGVLLIGVAVYLLSVLPGVPILYFWAVLFIVVAIYMGATQSLPEGASGWSKLFKGVGTLILIWGVLALVGAIYGERDILKPLPSRLFSAAPAVQMQGAGSVALKEHPFDRVNSIEELDKRMAQAVVDGKIVMIDYYADWCIQCVKMEKTTFSDIRVRTEMANRFVALQVDVTDPNDETRKQLKKRFGVFGPPASLFIDAQGNMLKQKNFYGYMGPDEFLALLQSM